MPYYVMLVHDPRAVRKVLRILRRHNSQIVAVAIVAYTRKQVLGGITQVGVSVVRGRLLVVRDYLTLPLQP